MSLQTLPGDPAAFEQSLGAYSRAVEAIDGAIDALDSMTAASEGRAMDAVRERVTTVRTRIFTARGRFNQTHVALTQYSGSFASARGQADVAVRNYRDAAHRYQWANHQIGELEEDLRVAAMSAAPEADRQQIEVQLARVRSDSADARRDMMSAERLLEDAEEDLDYAAQQAIALIDAAFGQTNDSWTDHVRHWAGNVGDFLVGIAEWVGGKLRAVLEVLRDVILVLLDLLAGVFLVLAVITVLLHPLFILGVVLVAGAIWGVTELLGVPDQWQLWLVAGFFSVAVPPLGLFIADRALHEALSPDPEITYVDSYEELESAVGGSPDSRIAAGKLQDPEYVPTDPATLLERSAMVDQAGGDHHTVVDIVTITDMYGNESHIVTLPSTKDWGNLSPLFGDGVGGLFTDSGATNDLDANMAEMLFPDVIDTQYERGVVETMQTLIDSGEPVMIVGFSQGGIMSELVTDQHSSEFNIQGVLAAGCPSTTSPIPESVEYVLVVHGGDVVPMTDLAFGTEDDFNGNHRSIFADTPAGMSTHSPVAYAETVGNNPELTDGLFEPFLVDPADVASGRIEVTSTQAVWTEG